MIPSKLKKKDMTYFLSKKKYQELQEELQELTTTGREEMGKKLDTAKSFGDLKENAEYHQARDDQGKMEARISEIEVILKDSEILKSSKHEKVEVGAIVTIAKKGSSKEQILHIVGTEETDISSGKISRKAPLVLAMENKKEGDIFDFVLPAGEIVNYRIVKIK